MTLSLTPANSLVLLIDWQDRLVGAMPPAIEASHRAKAEVLLRSAAAAGVPVVVTEQYPKGLGHTVESLRDAIRAVVEASGRTHIVVVGMESHICVWQTVRALTERGLSVHVPRDAVISRRTNDYEAALSLYLNTGAVVTSVEAVVFDWVRRAEGDVFKAISRLVR